MPRRTSAPAAAPDDPVRVDAYVLDVLLPDLVGHDRRPSALLVYLVLWRLTRGGRAPAAASLAALAEASGLSKRAVQGALGAAALGLAAACVALPWLADRRVDPWSLIAVPAAFLLLWRVAVHARRGAWARAGLAAVLLAIPIQWVAFQAVLPRLHAPWVSAHLDAAIPASVTPDRIGLVGHHEPSAVFALGAGAALLGDGAAGARFLAAGPGRVVAVEDRQRASFEAEARAIGLALPPAPFAVVEGFNYSRGRRVALRLWRTDPP